MKKVFPIKGAIQNYAWGGKEFIPKLMRLQSADNQSFAEVWLGAHQRGPAQLDMDGKEMSLKEFLEKNPKALGEKVINKFGKRLPYLFKVLDVQKMLSIQTHPTKEAAEIGFVREEKAGISITAFDRNYKDDNHKPEVMVAMTEFWLLHGFKSMEAIEEVLKSVPEFKMLLEYFQRILQKEVDNKLFHFYKNLMEMSQTMVDEILQPLAERLSLDFVIKKISKKNPDYWAALAFRDNMLEGGHFDRGVFSIYIFNLVCLQKGEGIFQDAGIPHAYLEGVNMELMANSDNVFRGGLTVKHVDVNELLEHMIFEAVIPKILTGTEIDQGVKVYQTPAPDFELTRVFLNDFETYTSKKTMTPETLIVMQGEVIVQSGDDEFRLERGGAFFVVSGAEYTLMSDGTSEIFKAAVP
ncbi:MAG: mannose-6-phosphate isomerase, class I [Saprospiraceae bacterium]